jgi:hypothetical protein
LSNPAGISKTNKETQHTPEMQNHIVFAGAIDVWADSYDENDKSYENERIASTEAHPLAEKLDSELKYWFCSSEFDMQRVNGKFVTFREVTWTSHPKPIKYEKTVGLARFHPIYKIVYISYATTKSTHCTPKIYNLLQFSKWLPLPPCPFH